MRRIYQKLLSLFVILLFCSLLCACNSDNPKSQVQNDVEAVEENAYDEYAEIIEKCNQAVDLSNSMMKTMKATRVFAIECTQKSYYSGFSEDLAEAMNCTVSDISKYLIDAEYTKSFKSIFDKFNVSPQKISTIQLQTFWILNGTCKEIDNLISEIYDLKMALEVDEKELFNTFSQLQDELSNCNKYLNGQDIWDIGETTLDEKITSFSSNFKAYLLEINRKVQ